MANVELRPTAPSGAVIPVRVVRDVVAGGCRCTVAWSGSCCGCWRSRLWCHLLASTRSSLPGPTGTTPRQPLEPFAGQTKQDSLLLSLEERFRAGVPV